MNGNAKRIGVLAGATLLTVGLAGPALANGTAAQGTSHTATSPTRTAPTLAQMQSWLTAKIDAHLSWIEKAEARVIASVKLTPQQKADATARLQARATALNALKAQVAAATTKADLEAALKTAAASGVLWAHRCHGHRDGDHRWAKSGDPDGKKSDPAKVTTSASGVRTIVVRTSTSTKAQGARTTSGQHGWSGQHTFGTHTLGTHSSGGRSDHHGFGHSSHR